MAVSVEPFLCHNLTFTPLVSANQKRPFGDISDTITFDCKIVAPHKELVPPNTLNGNVFTSLHVKLASSPLSPSAYIFKLIMGIGVEVGVLVGVTLGVILLVGVIDGVLAGVEDGVKVRVGDGVGGVQVVESTCVISFV